MSDSSEYKQNVVLFGGSFDPPHLGHHELCRALVADETFDRVWILPSANHPFGKQMAPFHHRVNMCSIAFATISPKVEIREEDNRSHGGGYTIDLVRYLNKLYPDLNFTLALGADNYQTRHKWKDFEELEKLIKVRFFGRRGFDQENKALNLDTPFPEVSSSELRESLTKGIIPYDLLPPGIGVYIEKYKLYG
jgi:nicotinate-nucleotide adenylyltransferase